MIVYIYNIRKKTGKQNRKRLHCDRICYSIIDSNVLLMALKFPESAS